MEFQSVIILTKKILFLGINCYIMIVSTGSDHITTLAQLRWCRLSCGLRSSECSHHHYYLTINCGLTMETWMSSTWLSPHTNYGYCNISFYSMLQMTILFTRQSYTMDGFIFWKMSERKHVFVILHQQKEEKSDSLVVFVLKVNWKETKYQKNSTFEDS